MATSTVPTPAPKNSNATAMVNTLGALVKHTRLTHITKAAAAITRRQPRRPTKIPVTGMAASEPRPRHNNKTPSVASLTARRSLAKGTSGAQDDIPSPAIKNAMRVDICCAKPGVGCALESTTDMIELTVNRAESAQLYHYSDIHHYIHMSKRNNLKIAGKVVTKNCCDSYLKPQTSTQ